MKIKEVRNFCGHKVTNEELEVIREVVESCPGISRTELANTVCELLEWKRPNGRLKGRECREYLEELEVNGLIRLPDRQGGRPRESSTAIPENNHGSVCVKIEGAARDFSPVTLKQVNEEKERSLFRELIGRYHYLGYRVPFGAHLSYLVYVTAGEPVVAGCLQFSSAAWRMACRDIWIGWDDNQRGRNLQKIVTNSRFILLPWVKVKNLSSMVLGLAARRIGGDWKQLYGVEPVLLETLVDTGRYRGTSYRSANWTCIGITSGRGRMDREGKRHGAAPKAIFVYPLRTDFRSQLKD